MYHALEDETHPAGAKDAGEQLYVLHVKQFREQMEYLQREGYRTFLLEELHSLDVWPEKSVVLTFDDGHKSNYTLALPVLQEFGFRAEFFITTAWIGTPHYLTEDQVLGLHKAGMGIGSHGVSHRYFQQMSNPEIKTELHVSKESLECITGKVIDSFSAPGGRITADLLKVAAETGYQNVAVSRPGYYRAGDILISRFDITFKNHSTFNDLLDRRICHLLRQLFRYETLRAVKKVLGNSAYDKIRNSLLKANP
jgi:peptidoglycan/xylan/chitin deacetylase (PgdA/CDA1 family)